MIFDTKVNGIPCLCSVLDYSPYIPAYGDFAPELSTFDYAILDRKGKPAPWLEKHLTDGDSDRLLEEFHYAQLADYYGY